MMPQFRERWHHMSKREQTLVLVGGIVLGLSLLFVLIVDPLLDTLDRLERQTVRKQKDLTELALLSQDYLTKRDRLAKVERRMPTHDQHFSLLTFMEEAAKALAQEANLNLPIRGKGEDFLPRLYELNPSQVRQCIAKYFDVPYRPAAALDLSNVPEIPARPPNLCAVCSHRATFYAVKKAAEGMETIYPTDIGCYTLGFLPPLSMGDFLICMGSSVGTSCGFSKVTGKKVIAYIGDSTFFHSGIPGLVNAVFNNHDFTLVILDNGTTAMTGHQPHPGVDMAKMNFEGYGQVSIENIVRAVGVSHVSVIRPYRVKKSIEAIREAIHFKGVSVVISQEACTLFVRGMKQLRGNPFYVSDKCKNHRDCINDLACPAFFIEGENAKIDPDLCTGCAVCAQVCPENAILPLKK